MSSDYEFPRSKLRSRLFMTSWMLPSCLYLFVARTLRSRRDSLNLAVIFMSAYCEPAVNRRLGRAWGVMDSLDNGVWRCRYLCGRMNVRVFRSLVLLVLFYGCETWTLMRDLRQRLNSQERDLRDLRQRPGLFGESLAFAGQTLCPMSIC